MRRLLRHSADAVHWAAYLCGFWRPISDGRFSVVSNRLNRPPAHPYPEVPGSPCIAVCTSGSLFNAAAWSRMIAPQLHHSSCCCGRPHILLPVSQAVGARCVLTLTCNAPPLVMHPATPAVLLRLCYAQGLHQPQHQQLDAPRGCLNASTAALQGPGVWPDAVRQRCAGHRSLYQEQHPVIPAMTSHPSSKAAAGTVHWLRGTSQGHLTINSSIMRMAMPARSSPLAIPTRPL